MTMLCVIATVFQVACSNQNRNANLQKIMSLESAYRS